jgi:hypothetical protein
MLSPGYGILFATLGGTMLLRNKAKRRWLNLLERALFVRSGFGWLARRRRERLMLLQP